MPPATINFQCPGNLVISYKWKTYCNKTILDLKQVLARDQLNGQNNAPNIPANQMVFYCGENKTLLQDTETVNHVIPANATLSVSHRQEVLNYLVNTWNMNPIDANNFFGNLTAEKYYQVSRVCYGDFISNGPGFADEFLEFRNSLQVLNAGLAALWTDHTFANDVVDLVNQDLEEGLTLNDVTRMITTTPNFSLLFYHRWRNLPWFAELLLIHQQTTGLCFLHAPVVLAHYEVVVATNGGNTQMPDIGKFVEYHLQLQATEFIRFISIEEGGFSLNVLQNILHLTSGDDTFVRFPGSLISRKFFSNLTELVYRFAKGHAALVIEFKVFEDFQNNDLGNPLVGKPQGKMGGYHSMVCIGIQKATPVTPDDPPAVPRYYLLMQNWWDTAYFVQMDLEYFLACSNFLIFVDRSNGAPVDYTPGIPLIPFSPYAETSIDHPFKPEKER